MEGGEEIASEPRPHTKYTGIYTPILTIVFLYFTRLALRRTRCKYVAVFLRPVNAVLIMLLITYFTTDRPLLSTFVLSVINNIITTTQDAIIDQENRGQIPVSDDRPN